MEKRNRDNNQKNKKKKNKRKSFFKRVFLLFLMILFMSFLSYFLFFTDYFNIKNVEVTGNVSLDANSILEIANIEVGENIFLQNNLSRENNVKNSFNVVNSIKIKQNLPDKVIIEVVEKEPAIVLATKGMYMLIDDNGEIIDKKDRLNNLSIPLLTGINVDEDLVVGQVVVKKEIVKALEFVSLVPEDKKYLVPELTTSNSSITVYPKGSYKVIIGETDNIEKKMLTLEALINNTDILNNTIDYIDITDPEKIIKKTKEGIS